MITLNNCLNAGFGLLGEVDPTVQAVVFIVLVVAAYSLGRTSK